MEHEYQARKGKGEEHNHKDQDYARETNATRDMGIIRDNSHLRNYPHTREERNIREAHTIRDRGTIRDNHRIRNYQHAMARCQCQDYLSSEINEITREPHYGMSYLSSETSPPARKEQEGHLRRSH